MRLLLMSPGESSQNPRKGTQISAPRRAPLLGTCPPTAQCSVPRGARQRMAHLGLVVYLEHLSPRHPHHHQVCDLVCDSVVLLSPIPLPTCLQK